MDYKNECNSDDDFDCSNSYGDNYNNNSNSGYNTNGGHLSNPNGLSKAELRKTNKPIMEKRRRARINHCLNELKSLILEAMKKDPARHTKLEKADILEMTVKHLQSVQRQQLNMAIQTDPSVIHKFKTGFVECSEEVNRYINQLDGVDAGVRQRLTNHLTNCATNLEQIGSMTNFNNGYRGQMGTGGGANSAANIFGPGLGNPLGAAVTTPASLFPPLPLDLNNNNNGAAGQQSNPAATGAPIQMGGVQLIPSRLPSGEIALIVPNTGVNPAALLSTNNNVPFATWRHAAASNVATAAGQLPGNGNLPPLNAINEFSVNLQRMSAFSKPPQQPLQKPTTHSSMGFNIASTTAFHQPQNNLHHNTTATTSPPLSPISSSAVSVSSHGDDSSLMHTSSDFPNSRPSTPPNDHSTAAVLAATAQHSFSGVFSSPPPSSAETSLTLSHTSSLSSSLLSTSATSTHLQQQQVSSTSGGGSVGDSSIACPKRTLSDVADSNDSSDEQPAKKYQTSLHLTLGDKCADELEAADNCWRPW